MVGSDWRKLSLAVLAGVLVGCGTPESQAGPDFGKAVSGPSVTAATPSSATQDTTLDVQISGSGFDNRSTVQLLLAGVADPRVKTNSTRYVSGTSLTANVTIAVDAVTSAYDVAVTTGSGKKGIGSDLFTVNPKGSSSPSVSGVSPAIVPQDTTLDVTVSGSGFDAGTQVVFGTGGTANPAIHVNSTTSARPSSVVVNVTIAPDATGGTFDVMVTTAAGLSAVGSNLLTVVPLRVLSSTGGGAANGGNAAGVVVGQRVGGCSELPVVWPVGGPRQDLPLLAGTCSGQALTISATGIIAGYSGPSYAPSPPVLWLPNGGGYAVQALGPLADGKLALISNVNSSGHVAGRTVSTQVGVEQSYAFWGGSGWIPLIPPSGGASCSPYGVSDADEIVGTCQRNGIAAGVYWSSPYVAGSYLPTLPGYSAHHPAWINANGVVAGYAIVTVKRGLGPAQPVVWEHNGGVWTVQLLGDLGGGKGWATGVDDAGQVTGYSQLPNGDNRAFSWSHALGMRDLGSLGAQSWASGIVTLTSGTAIATGRSEANGIEVPVVWRP